MQFEAYFTDVLRAINISKILIEFWKISRWLYCAN